jgi:hypothetical protein
MSKNVSNATPTTPFDEFGSNFDDVVAKMANDVQEAMPLEAMDQTANALEYASKRRQELEDIMNDGMARSGVEWDEIFDEAEQLDGQIEKLTNKQLDAMSKYSNGWDDTSDVMDRVYADIDDAMPIDTEFGDLEGAMKAAQDRMYPDDEFGDLDGAIARNQADDEAKSELARESRRGNKSAMQDVVSGSSPTNDQAAGGRKISMDSFTMSKNGMPVFTPKSTVSAAPDKKKDENETDAESARLKRQNDAKKEDEKGKDGDKKTPASDSKTATLDDVVKSLNALNTKMGQLIDVNEAGHKSTTKAAKSNAANIYQR